ncbi:Acriflavin resistance protein [Caenispirillum salinarum AK4]|uniref:Acriflavin resistance protein n=1 Tax=Caenispirillum salinarum AK4 TaxID=1238182 RepID=K9GX52_9PROT|nr:efflux RND transporter permease subunit [Caenispirillum salinarum]EKV29827.1 Acriflavin resistance protein [Caenispirillum salinarum AK4]
MVLSDLSIKRPVLATVMSLVIVLVGIIAYDRLTVREYPNIDEPVVKVETRYPGATAEIIETQVTQPLEESLAGIEGIDVMTSTSRPEQSQVEVKFRLTRDPDTAANDVRDRVARVRGQLPSEIDEPVISKEEADAQPIIYLAFSSDRHSPLEVTDYADRYVKDRLQNIDGVANVMIFGERRYAMRLWLDRARLAAYGLTVQDVEGALRRQNVEIPSGRIESAEREFTVLAETDLRTPAQFEDLIIKRADGYLVRLKDVGRAEIGAESERSAVRFNGQSAVALGVVKQATANPLDVSAGVREALPIIEGGLPEGMSVDIGYDSSIFIDRSIANVFTTIGEAVVLVILVIFVFLRSIRATLIPLVTIPVSLIGAFALMYAFGFSINTLTLLAMVLAIGLVVDDAIVMLENIHRHVEEGLSPVQAAFKGSREIAFAVVAMTLTLAAVYAPIGFMEGRTGRLFTEFALTLAGAVLVSGFVALTLSPMMCSKLLRHEKKHSTIYNAIERVMVGMTNAYRAMLRVTLRANILVIGVALGVAGGAYVLFTQLPSELAPTEDRGTIIGIGIAPEGSTLDYSDKYARQMEQVYANTPEAERYFVVTGFPVVSQIISFVGLTDWEDRDRKQQEIVKEMQPKLFGGIPGIMAFPTNPPSLGQSPVSKPVQFVIQTTAPYDELQTMVDSVVAKAREYPGFINLDTDLKLNKPQLSVQVDREKVADVGADVAEIGRTLESMLGGRQVTRFKQNGKQYDVIVQVADVDRATPSDLSAIYVRGADGSMIQLSNLLTVTETVAPKELNHFNQMRSATITANLAPGFALSDGLATLEGIAAEVLPPEALVDYAGPSREYKESSASLYVTFLLALGFIYLVLAAQFESFVDPFVIMLSVPLSVTGALLALYLTGNTLNVYSQIGLVTLIGLITKHGILIVEFANQLQEQGRSKRDAVIEASALRLRPILMTTGAMVLGAVPLAIAVGAGAESRAAIGWVIVGGMTFGTLLTLFVVPTAYLLMARGHGKAMPEPDAKLMGGAPAE